MREVLHKLALGDKSTLGDNFVSYSVGKALYISMIGDKVFINPSLMHDILHPVDITTTEEMEELVEHMLDLEDTINTITESIDKEIVPSQDYMAIVKNIIIRMSPLCDCEWEYYDIPTGLGVNFITEEGVTWGIVDLERHVISHAGVRDIVSLLMFEYKQVIEPFKLCRDVVQRDHALSEL